MAIVSSFQLKGDAKLHRALKRLGSKVAKKIGKSAMKKALKPVIKSARVNVPVDTGLLKKSLGSRVYIARRRRSGRSDLRRFGAVIAVVGARKSFIGVRRGGGKSWPVKYHHLVEGGSHKSRGGWDIYPGKLRKALHVGSGTYAGGFFAKVRHKGFKAQPHLGPALDRNRRRVMRVLKVQLWRGIRKALREAA